MYIQRQRQIPVDTIIEGGNGERVHSVGRRTEVNGTLGEGHDHPFLIIIVCEAVCSVKRNWKGGMKVLSEWLLAVFTAALIDIVAG